MGKGGIVAYPNDNYMKILTGTKGSVLPKVLGKMVITIFISLGASASWAYFDAFDSCSDYAFGQEPSKNTFRGCMPNYEGTAGCNRALDAANGMVDAGCHGAHYCVWKWADMNASTAAKAEGRPAGTLRNESGTSGTCHDAPGRPGLAIPSSAYLLAGKPLVFLLVIRSGISYTRFWEARGHLGTIMMHARDLSRVIAYATGLGGASDVRLKLSRYVLVFWLLMSQHLDGMTKGLEAKEGDMGKYLRKVFATTGGEQLILTQSELLELTGKNRRPLVILGWLTREVLSLYRKKAITMYEFDSMNENIMRLIEGFNGVDKISAMQLPIPFAQMIVIFIGLFCYSIPLYFVTSFGWFCFFPSCVVTLSLFGINEVAIEIEEPFGDDENDLPVEKMGDVLHADICMFLEEAVLDSAAGAAGIVGASTYAAKAAAGEMGGSTARDLAITNYELRDGDGFDMVDPDGLRKIDKLTEADMGVSVQMDSSRVSDQLQISDYFASVARLQADATREPGRQPGEIDLVGGRAMQEGTSAGGH